jgi:hypothetical protein
MQKYEVLIEENAFGETRPVKVSMDIPISELLADLVETLHLPKSDLFGNPLVYALYHAPSGRMLPSEQTLESSGILPGMRLRLDSLQSDRIPIPDEPEMMNGFIPPQSPQNYDLYVSETLFDGALFSTSSPDQSISELDVKIKRRRSSRRAFLLSCGIVLGVSGAGVGYAAYRGALNTSFLQTNVPHKVVAQQNPQSAKKTPVSKMNVPTQIWYG